MTEATDAELPDEITDSPAPPADGWTFHAVADQVETLRADLAALRAARSSRRRSCSAGSSTTSTPGCSASRSPCEGPLVPAHRRRLPRGAADGTRRAPAGARPRLPRAGRGRVRPPRLRRHAHAVRHRLRGRVAQHRVAAPPHPPRQVPRRVPARAAHADARRADGVDLPADVGRSAAREHRHRRRARRAGPRSASTTTRTRATRRPRSSSR